jgi:hypothetical protein
MNQILKIWVLSRFVTPRDSGAIIPFRLLARPVTADLVSQSTGHPGAGADRVSSRQSRCLADLLSQAVKAEIRCCVGRFSYSRRTPESHLRFWCSQLSIMLYLRTDGGSERSEIPTPHCLCLFAPGTNEYNLGNTKNPLQQMLVLPAQRQGLEVHSCKAEELSSKTYHKSK